MTQEEREIIANNCPHWNECTEPCKNCPTFKKMFKSCHRKKKDIPQTIIKAVEDANKKKQTTVPTVEVPTDLIDNIIKFCETQAIYDKLGRYGDFYYKLKTLRK